MLNYTAIDKENKKLSFKVPTEWAEVPFKDFVIFHEHKEDLSFVVSTITGLPTDFINDPDYVDFTGKLLNVISDMGKLPRLDKNPKSLWVYNDERINLEVERFKWTVSLGQQVDAIGYINEITKEDEEGNPIPPSESEAIKLFPTICAMFMQPYFKGKVRDKYDPKRWEYDNEIAESLIPFFEGYNFIEVVRLGGFFLSKLQRLKTDSVDSFLPQNTVKQKLMRVIKTLLKPLVNIRCYILYRKAVRLSERK